VERAAGLEPATASLENWNSSQLSYARAERSERRRNVRCRWQLAQTIPHLSTSASIRSVLAVQTSGDPLEVAFAMLRGGSARRHALALEDRAGDVGLVDDEAEHRPIAPPAEEQVAVDVHAGVGQRPGDPGHASGAVGDLRQD
jgi:hypothetical protein